MAKKQKSFTRREFIKRTTAASAAICAAGVTSFNILPAKAARKIKLRAGSFTTKEFVNTIWLDRLAEKTKEKSNGEIDIRVFPNAQLGGEKDLAESCKMGTVDIVQNSGTISQWVKGLAINEFPFFYDGYDQAVRAIQGPILGKYLPEVEKAGFKVLGAARNCPRQLYAKKPITHVDGFKGLKLRVQEIPVFIDVYKALGASPTPIAAPEIYSALQTGIVEAQTGGPDWVYSLKSYEVLTHMMMTNHTISSEWVFMSMKKWKKLSQDARKVIQEAASEVEQWYVDKRLEYGQAGIDSMTKTGIIVVPEKDIDKKSMMEKAAPVHEKWAKKLGFADLLQKVRELA